MVKILQCVICELACASALRAVDLGRPPAPDVPLCGRCYDDAEKLLRAVAFARASWSQRRARGRAA